MESSAARPSARAPAAISVAPEHGPMVRDGKSFRPGAHAPRSNPAYGPGRPGHADAPVPSAGAKTPSVAESTREFSVILIDTKADNPNHYIVNSILAALRQSPRISRVDKAEYANAVRLAQIHRYDLLLAVDGEAVNLDVMARLTALVTTSVLWVWEDPYERQRATAIAPLFDHVLTNDAGSVDFYRGRARHMPLAAEQYRAVRGNDRDYDYDISFVGSAWPNRVNFLRRLLRRRPALRSRIVLSYHAGLPRTYLDLPESSYVGSLSHHDFLHVANRSRLCLTLDRNFSGDGLRPRARSPGPRLFEIALAGGFQLVDVSAASLAGCFDAGQEIEAFHDVGDCIEKIDRALGQPERRIGMARAAQARAAAEHSYARRIDTILDMVAGSSAARGAPAQGVKPARRHRLLFVTHNIMACGNFGGVEVYQETIADQLRAEYDILYYRPAQRDSCDGMRCYVLTDSRHNILQTETVPDFDAVTTLSAPQAEAAFARVLTEHAVDLIHFHHLINHCPSLPIIARILGVPSVTTLQDFWPVCTRFNLIGHRGQYCDIASRPKVTCDICLGASGSIAPGAQDFRRNFFRKVLASCDLIIGNAPTTTEICRAIYPDLPAAKFIPLGLPLPGPSPSAAMTRAARPHHAIATKKPRAAPLRVVFLGNFSRIKGAETFIQAARILGDENILFNVCGRIEEPFGATLRDANLPNVTIEGAFQPGELDLSRFDMSLHLSIWPETYCITLSEAWQAGLVPIVTACGALADRVTDRQNGFQIPIEGAGELVALLRRLEANRQELAEMRARIVGSLWLTAQQHCQQLGMHYANLINAYKQPNHKVLPAVDTGAPTNFSLSGEALTPVDWTRPEDVHLPSPPDGADIPFAPLRRELAAVQRALAAGRIDTGRQLRWHLDAIGGPADLRTTATITDPGAIAMARLSDALLQIFGWLHASGRATPTLMLAVRAVTLDVILRPIYLHDRADLRVSGTGAAFGIGFATDPFPPQMLDQGVYALEFMQLSKVGVLSVVPFGALAVSPSGIAQLTAPGRTLVRVPLPGAAWQDMARLPSRLIGVMDHIDVLLAPKPVSGAADGPAVLVLNGWALADGHQDEVAQLALQISGDTDTHVALTIVTRIDVQRTLHLRDSAATGYDGTICLSGLASGTYTLELVMRLATGTARQRLADLQLGADGSVTVERRPESAELQDFSGRLAGVTAT